MEQLSNYFKPFLNWRHAKHFHQRRCWHFKILSVVTANGNGRRFGGRVSRSAIALVEPAESCRLVDCQCVSYCPCGSSPCSSLPLSWRSVRQPIAPSGHGACRGSWSATKRHSSARKMCLVCHLPSCSSVPDSHCRSACCMLCGICARHPMMLLESSASQACVLGSRSCVTWWSLTQVRLFALVSKVVMQMYNKIKHAIFNRLLDMLQI